MSLLLSGALTWLLVRNLELQSAQEQLDRAMITTRPLVLHEQCMFRPRVATSPGVADCPLDDPIDYQERLTALSAQLGPDRLLLLNGQRRVVFDSAGQNTAGQAISVTPSKRFTGVWEAQTTLGGETYLAAATTIAPPRDPLRAAYAVLALPQGAFAAAATSDLVPRLLLAGGAALLLAMLLVLLVSRSLTRPLAKLASAAEDIAAGHYSRRVGIRGTDEIGTLGTAFDRMAEAVERARRVQREFLANVSHELKTPLTSLIGFSQALVDGSIKTELERTRAATIVHEESERVLRMAQELLDLARVEAGSIELHITAVDLGGHLQQELAMVRPRAEARGLVLEMDVPADIPPVAADPERLHQILDNLMDNAVKYAPTGSKVVAYARLNGDSVDAVISNPAGPNAPDPDRMFERFYRADPSRSGAAGGVGLGLAISQELASAMAGRLWADIDGAGILHVHLTLPASPIRKGAPMLAAVVDRSLME